jgi:hypothetical protein
MRKVGTAAVILISLVSSTVGVFAGVAHADPTPVTFRPRVEFGTPAPPWAVATGDLNGDTSLDVVTANGGASVSVLLGDGAGGLGPKTDFATGNSPTSVATGDLNGDPFLDVVTANYGDASVSVLLGDGAGGLGPKTDFPAGDSPRSVVLGDLNGDTALDLALANNDISVSVLLGDGAGSFGPATARPVGFARSVAMGDLNGDTFLDLAVATNLDPAVSVLFGDGLGGFGPETKTDGGNCCEPFDVVIGDLNGDTFLDLVTANGTGDRVSVRLGDGIGGFGPPADYATGQTPQARPALGDLNGDTFLDAVTANSEGNSVSVLLGDGTGALVSRTDIPTLNGLGVVLGDLNGDARPDVVVANSVSDNSVSVLLNTTGVPATVPDAPTIGTASAGHGEATVSWTAPAFDGGAALTGYVVTPYIGAAAQTPVAFGSTATSQTVLGLANGTTYTFTVAATNPVGTGPASDASNPVTPTNPPAVEVVPNTGLNGGDTVEVRLTDFAPLASLGWAQCIVPFDVNPQGNCMEFDPPGRAQADATGALIAASRLQRFVYVPNFDRWVDCTDPAESCVIAAADITDIPNGVSTPLGFDPAPAPPAVRGTISLAPSGPVPGPGSVVGVIGSGFRPDEVVDVYQCVADPVHPSDCNRPATSATTDGTGAFTADITVGATVTPLGGSTTDCFSASGACAIAAAEAVDFPGTVTGVTMATAPTVPAAPSILRNATGGNGEATVSWTPPASDGGAAITGYVVTPYVGFYALSSVTFASPATTQTVTGLTNGITYRFKVAALNAAGTGPASKVTNPVTPAATVPGAPTIGAATAGNAQATVSWTAPASDGGAAITGYVVTPYIGYYPLPSRSFSSTATTQMVTGLTNGTQYRFRVQAINAVGTGGYSKVTNPVTPTA